MRTRDLVPTLVTLLTMGAVYEWLTPGLTPVVFLLMRGLAWATHAATRALLPKASKRAAS